MHEKKKKQLFKGSDCHDEWLFWLSTAESQTISSMAQSTPSHGAMVGDSFILHTVGRCPDTLVKRGEDDDTTGAKTCSAVNATWRRYLVLTQIIKSDQFNSIQLL